tara:strand:- start:348 stop:686 length:339 start_codon:yes stop_codon:yes gene_type:complete
MSAGKSANKHLALEEWKRKMQDTLNEIPNTDVNPEESKDLYDYFDRCQSWSLPRIRTIAESGIRMVFVLEKGMLRMAERTTGGIKTTPDRYLKEYYTGDLNRGIGQVLHRKL